MFRSTLSSSTKRSAQTTIPIRSCAKNEISCWTRLPRTCAMPTAPVSTFYVQKYFEQFHETIRTDYDSDQKLREKRDIVLDKITKNLRDADRPSFDVLHQGSYSKHARTGVKMIEGLRYDIDIGLRFAIKETEYTAKEVRGWVWEAVGDHTDGVQDKGPCIRVIYAGGFHLDLVSYAHWTDDVGQEQYRLAHKDNGWRPTDPPSLLKYIKDARTPFGQLTDSATRTDQFRRVVRYLKR